jgi:predicted DNA-binding ribbon-helix-helix protein
LPGLRKRSLVLAGHGTSLALEPEFWAVLEAAAAARSLSLAGLVAAIDAERGPRPLASACRVAALAHAAERRREEGSC